MPTFLFALTTRPFPATVRSEEKRLVELAVVAKELVEVAEVEVERVVVRLVMVDVAELERMPPLSVERVATAREPVKLAAEEIV